jgi:hypothetical protein
MIHEDKHCSRSIALISRGTPWPVVVEQFIGVFYRWGEEVYRTGGEASLTKTLEKIELWSEENPDE